MTSSTNPAVEQIDGTRRSLFALAVALPMIALGLGARAEAAAKKTAAKKPVAKPSSTATPPAANPCFNEATLSASQKNQRKSINFRLSTDPQKRCGGCMYFSGSTEPMGCGKCQILLNGPVSADNVCNSWTKKA